MGRRVILQRHHEEWSDVAIFCSLVEIAALTAFARNDGEKGAHNDV